MTLSPVSARPAAPADAAAVARLLIGAWLMGPSAEVTARAAALDPDKVTASWRAAITDPPPGRHLTLVACEGVEVVGFLASAPAGDHAGPDDVEVLELVVAPAARRRGHGSRLLAAWADLARESGATGGVCWAGLADEPARAFLQGAGWGPDGATRTLDLLGDGAVTVRQARLTTDLRPGTVGG